MHAFLYIGGTQRSREEHIQHVLETHGVQPFHRISLIPGEKHLVGISDVRAFIHRLNLAPEGESIVAGIIPDAALLTPHAQQALLKTIEEPPKHVRLYIGAGAEASVLPTIVSRCHCTLIAAGAPADTDTQAMRLQQITELCSLSPGHRIQLLQDIGKTKDDYLTWIDQAIAALAVPLQSGNRTHRTADGAVIPIPYLIHGFLDAKQQSAHNVNPLALLERLFLPL